MKSWVWLAIIFLAILGFLWFIFGSYRRGVEVEKEASPGEPSRAQAPPPRNISIAGGKVFGEDERGNRVWEAEVEVIKFEEAKDLLILQGVRCAFLYHGKPDWTLVAPVAKFYPEAGKLYLSGGIAGESKLSNSSFHVDEIFWHNAEKKIVGKGIIKFKKGQVELKGNLIEIYPQDKRVKIKGNARLVLGGVEEKFP